ncbi:MAG: DNA alkylation repair protein [Acidimicrobiales bacterium]
MAALPSPADLVADLRAALEQAAVPDQAEPMTAYMKHQFDFLGVPAPARRAAQKPTLDVLAAATGDELVAFARACWADHGARELQYAAADALRRHNKALDAGHLPALAELITTRPWWDTVDALATHAVGPLVARHPELSAVMDSWVEGDDLWLARTAILHQLLWKERTDAARLFAYADRRATDPDFFIRKALGWALRQYARTDPEAVRAYVESRIDRLSPLTQREALKRI